MKTLLSTAATLLSLLILASPGVASWEEGVSAFRAGRFEDAVDQFQSLVNAQPVAPQGHYMLGLSLAQMGQTNDALRPLTKALELEPADASYRLTLAQTQLKAGRAGDALETLAAQDPAAVPGARRESYGQLLAKVATESGRDELAGRALDGALAVDAGSKPMWLAAAQIAQRLDRTRPSFEAYTKAYRLDRSDGVLGRQTVQTAFAAARAQRDEDQRRDWYQRAAPVAAELASAVPTAEHLLLAGEALLGAKDRDGARSWFERAAKADATDAWPHFYLASCASEEPEAALEHLQAALERSPDAALTQRVHNARGAALRRLERFDDAEQAYGAAGNQDKIAEMRNLAEIQDGNDKWDAEKRRCEERERAVQAQLKDAELLKGTAGWREIEEMAEDALAECRPYLDEAG